MLMSISGLKVSLSIVIPLILIFLSVIVDLFIQLAVEKVEFKKLNKIRIIIVACAFGMMGYFFESLYEIKINTKLLSYNLDESIDNIESIFISQSEGNDYLMAVQKTKELPQNSTLQKLFESELSYTNEKLRQINNAELLLKREEVIPKWESLIEHSGSNISATNIVSFEDWKYFSPSEGEEVHTKALKNKVDIKRIFIYDYLDTTIVKQTLLKAKTQAAWGVKVRLIDGSWLMNNPFISDILRDIGTMDVVIYDKECLLLTSVGNDNKIISGTVTNNAHRLKRSIEFFDKLWNEADSIEN